MMQASARFLILFALCSLTSTCFAADPLIAGDNDLPAPSLGNESAAPAPSTPAAANPAPAPSATPSPAPTAPAPTPAPVAATPKVDTPPPASPPSALPPPSDGAATTAGNASTGTPTPEEQPAIPVTSIPGKTANSPKANSLNLDTNRDIYEQYDEYKGRQKDKQSAKKTQDQRAMFPHEDGAWQVGLMVSRNALAGYDFNWQPKAVAGSPQEYGTVTQGGNLQLTWFPVRSLTFGRLGFGISGGGYWTTFSTTTASGINIKASPQNVVTYGIRAVYEFDYFLGQLFVPYGVFGLDQVNIQAYSVSDQNNNKVVSFDHRNVTSQYFGGGFHFNLNRIEPIVASRALVNTGVKKFYLTYLAQQRTGALKGNLTHNFGLNFEF